jgi:hypothetical protein
MRRNRRTKGGQRGPSREQRTPMRELERFDLARQRNFLRRFEQR